MSPDAIAPRRSPPTRVSLLARLKDWHDEQSWDEFARIYERLIFETARRSGLTTEEGQEVVQETLLTVAKKITGFTYDPAVGSFKNWLLQITRRRVVDQLRKRRPDLAQNMATSTPVDVEQLSDPAVPQFEALWNEEWRRAQLEMARAMVKRKVGKRQYQMFDYYVLQQMPLKRVTSLLGVNAAQVYMAKYRISRMLKQELGNLEEPPG